MVKASTCEASVIVVLISCTQVTEAVGEAGLEEVAGGEDALVVVDMEAMTRDHHQVSKVRLGFCVVVLAG
jgi:hypothetical protein